MHGERWPAKLRQGAPAAYRTGVHVATQELAPDITLCHWLLIAVALGRLLMLEPLTLLYQDTAQHNTRTVQIKHRNGQLGHDEILLYIDLSRERSQLTTLQHKNTTTTQPDSVLSLSPSLYIRESKRGRSEWGTVRRENVLCMTKA